MGIIALLSALLFSVFARAREKGRSAICQSNLKQIGLVVQQYTQDNNGILPNFDFVSPQSSNPYPLHSYVKTWQIFQCPSAEVKPKNSASEIPYFDYAFNNKLQKLVVGLVPLGIEEAKITNISRTIMSGDSYRFSESGGFISYYETQAEGPGSTRHSGGANYLFCDYHVKWFRPEQTDGGATKFPCSSPENQALSATWCLN